MIGIQFLPLTRVGAMIVWPAPKIRALCIIIASLIQLGLELQSPCWLLSCIIETLGRSDTDITSWYIPKTVFLYHEHLCPTDGPLTNRIVVYQQVHGETEGEQHLVLLKERAADVDVERVREVILQDLKPEDQHRRGGGSRNVVTTREMLRPRSTDC